MITAEKEVVETTTEQKPLKQEEEGKTPKLSIVFHYDTELVFLNQHGNHIEIARPVTSCEIRDSKKNTVSQAVVRLHHGDVANKLVARTYAFKNAVNKLDIPNKATRRALWNDFRGKMRQVS